MEAQNEIDFEAKKTAPVQGKSDYYNGLNKSTLDYIAKLTLGRFYGELHLTFDGGKIVHGKTIRSFKP